MRQYLDGWRLESVDSEKRMEFREMVVRERKAQWLRSLALHSLK